MPTAVLVGTGVTARREVGAAVVAVGWEGAPVPVISVGAPVPAAVPVGV